MYQQPRFLFYMKTCNQCFCDRNTFINYKKSIAVVHTVPELSNSIQQFTQVCKLVFSCTYWICTWLLNSIVESFYSVYSVCTFTGLNSGFGRPWNKLGIFFVCGTFIMPQNKSFGRKKFWISCMGSKMPFW